MASIQRYCVLLFRAELGDPNAQEYGRAGQDQGGIDILGRRRNDADHHVGIQCRLIAKPLTETGILDECRAALGLKARLKEIVFATTAPDDTGGTNAAIEVERKLREEGHELRVIVYGWGNLQTLIRITTLPTPPLSVGSLDVGFAGAVYGWDADARNSRANRGQVAEGLRQTTLPTIPREIDAAGPADEDPALHARIDTYRTIFKDQKQPRLAEQGLLALLESERLDNKSWARFRIQTNLGSIAFELGREAEGAARFEAAYEARPDDPNAIANLGLARMIQGRFEEAIDLTRMALSSEPRAMM